MRLSRWFFVVMLLATGCMGMPSLPNDPATKPAEAVRSQEKTAAPVTAEQVTDANAYEKAEALEVELTKATAEEAHTKTEGK